MKEVLAPYKKHYKDLSLYFEYDPYGGTCIKIIGVPKEGK
jgi:hypothetical protein